ncbi:FAD/NAD(P)-binding domain-containing protein [Coniophora puteana RWD-64-598 SS2]|uniref:FAD/NAD(P)-binding domain-containing protein n=1 Tax=Coniophora puteana (strain RWD-64-598) TaxID=741705 RepID=A0A5M3MPB7_CONPW|nr:FAD/NAD(P)-binding domain-containing protein [Coniophora puteana RWD-64-598 SS2]EIW80574.1 FAD/NAD(P)-binding domain-containing protein [Coniophora puteana RWD-64-598 SS2]
MISKEIDASEIAIQWITSFNKAAEDGDLNAFVNHFLSNGWLRDVLCFAWDFRSVDGHANLTSFLSESLGSSAGTRFSTVGMCDIALDTDSTLGSPSTFPVPGTDIVGVQGAFRFALREPAARGRGFFRLMPSQEGYKALVVYTAMHELVGHEESIERPRGIPLDATKMTTWEEGREKEVEAIESDPTVLVVGGGQCGLMVAARFRRMGIRALVIEKTPRVGDVWRNRYPTLTLHLAAHFSSFLYQSYPTNFPKYIGRTKLADFMESYAIQQELTVWTSSTLSSVPAPVFDEAAKRWTIVVNHAGNEVTLNPKHLIIATGIGAPYVPQIPGQNKFKGDVYHSDLHPGAAKYTGKKVVVIGAGNASADICQDFVSKGAAYTTFVQRSATCVGSLKWSETVFGPAYPENRDLEDADLMMNSMPPRLLLQVGEQNLEESKKADAALHRALEEKGMKLTWEYKGVKAGGVIFQYEKLAGSTMLDTGIGQLIIDGHVKVKQGTEPSHFEENAIVFNDGSKLEADAVVLATGYYPITTGIESLLGSDIAANVGPIWGLDSVGELRRTWRPSGQQGLWIFLGGFMQARYHSRHVALQILAEELGIKGVTEAVPGNTTSSTAVTSHSASELLEYAKLP